MAELKLLYYLPVFLMSGLKFMVGVGMSLLMHLTFWEQFLLTAGGGIVGVGFFTYLGDKVRAWWRGRRPAASPAASAKWRRLWERYGLWGIAFLTPPLLSPPVGTALALAFGSPRNQIFLRMSLAMIAWGLFFALLGQKALHYLN
ncbi:MAG: hypothetical protein NZ958_08600 [Bacteroidia bacterium]|nr:hypothetical protein [Bacteroidia bacterium]MDW8089762.1 hypothetical protein [Bacteroidia bacterium]